MSLIVRVACAVLLLGFVAPVAARSQTPRGAVRVEMHEERCTACPKPIDGQGIEITHRGRKVRLHVGGCAASWIEGRDAIFADLQPHAALWDEPVEVPSILPGGWFAFGLLVLLGLVCGAVTGYLAIERGRPAVPWFFAGFFLNAIGIVALLITTERVSGVPGGLRKVPVTALPVACASCGHANHPSAARCDRCGDELEPGSESEVVRVALGVRRADA